MGLYLFFHHLTILLAVSEFAALCYPLLLADDIIAVNCGSSGNSTALDGRQWTGDVASRYIILQGSRGRRNLVSSSPVGKHLIPRPHPVPYMTAQISRSTFTYTFHVTPGQKFIRLHFYPTEYPGFERSKAFFTVKAGPYTLLSNFSAALTADVLALPSFAKEFCVHVEDSQPLILTFSPSSEEAYAFINGIEIVSIPTGLYHSREDDDPAVHVIGKKFRYPIFLDTSFALETVHRLNVGGSSILPIEDTGMFREWFEDSNYFLESRAMPVTTTIRINYAVIPTYSAPTRVYQTSRSMTRDMQAKERISFTWKLPVDQGFRYLLRFHFCELEYENKEVGQMEFSIFIENQIAEANADLIKWAGGNGIAVYRDYMVMMEGDRTEGKRDMTITLSPHKSHDDKGNMEHSSDAILKGLEVFKLSNPDNNLAGVNMVPIAHASTSHNSKPQKLVLGCGIYTIANILISVLIILDVVVYPLAYLGQKSRQEDTRSSFPSEGPYCRFSLAELQLATRNFDNGLVIGSGGFGNVYKGLINGGTTTVAIKRMKPKSRQGPNEFWMEIETISKFRHKHLVSLLGYCDECDEKILVYEYMEQGTLAKHLYKKNTEENGNVCHMPWEQRLKICIGAARGLDYLHTGIQGGVIHRDVKTTNILLNKDMVAKVSDFGLCKMGTTSHSVSHVSTNVKGTFGYFDPHYFSTRILTKKSDVYAFGVVLLEVLCGRPAVDLSLEEEQRSLSLWAQGSIKDGKLDEIIDPILRDELPIPSKSLEVFAEVARKCLHTHPNGRSTMADVVVSLESALAYLHDDRCKDSSTTQGNEDVVNVDAADEDKENVLNLGGAEETKNDEIIQLDDDAVLAEVPSPSTAVQYPENIPLGKKGAQGRFTKVFHKISTAFLPRTVDFGWINRKANYYGSSSRHSLLRSDSNSGQLSHKTTFWHHTGSCGTDKRTISAGNRKSMSTTSGKEPYPDGQVLRIPNIRAFSLSELRNATRNFRGDRCIGEGGFGKVYKGWLAEKTALQNGSSSVIAVKEWNSNGLQGFEEWQCEVNILGRLSHPNIIKLLGYCRESERLFLVFEFMQKGSLENHLFGRGPSFDLLPWETRLKILRGAIRGLAFLHSLEPQIIFRDFKSSNILLDASYNARITDFGLAKLGPATTEESHVTTRVMGTYGYAAPEYIATGQLYVASDVYAVGVVMVEMLTGLRALDPCRNAGQHDLVEMCRPFLAIRRKFERIMDSCWKGKYPAKVAWQIGQLSLKCLQREPKRRPSMQQVVEILESFENPKESS